MCETERATDVASVGRCVSRADAPWRSSRATTASPSTRAHSTAAAAANTGADESPARSTTRKQHQDAMGHLMHNSRATQLVRTAALKSFKVSMGDTCGQGGVQACKGCMQEL